ncbi:hypothetical protein [Streptomyces sp. PT12]|nr:hypothetical protein [Streptomyces sp. PT12]
MSTRWQRPEPPATTDRLAGNGEIVARVRAVVIGSGVVARP